MNRHLLLAGLCGATMFTAWACGSDVADVPPAPVQTTTTTTTTSAGGMGGAGGMASTTTTSTTTTTTGAGGFADVCEEACFKIENECMFPAGACQFAPLDCSDEQGECTAQCVADAECGDLIELVNPNTPVPAALQACLLPCAGDCLECGAESCMTEISACGNDASCQGFLQCAASCEDEACVSNCAAQNPSQATSDVVACIGTNCSVECAGQGGAGGTGGAQN